MLPLAKLEEQLKRFEELEAALADPAVVADQQRYQKVAKERAALSKTALRIRRLRELDREIADNDALAAEADFAEMANADLARLRPERAALEEELTDLLLADPGEDHDSLIMEIRAGTGGEEASLFARELHEMYLRYAATRGWKTEVLEFSTSETKGFKEVTFSVAGDGAFRTLRFESGGHRVQRVPETETQGRIQTSMATVAVLAEPEEVEVEIRPEDIELQFTRSSGPGGQSVNKTSSAVRVTHKPSGLVVFCQEEKSQHKNRAKALRLLRSRLYEAQLRIQQQARASTRKSLVGSGDRSERIRTYNFPQNRCTDHRINESFNLGEIFAGTMDKLVVAIAKYDRQQRLDEAAGAA